MYILPFIQQQHGAEVSHSFVREPRAGDQFQTLQLPKVSWITQHVDVQEFRYVSTSADKDRGIR